MADGIIGVFTNVDEDGNEQEMYPVTKMAAVDGLERELSSMNDNIDNCIYKCLEKSGGVMTGNIDMGSNNVTGLGTPTEDGDATNKKFVTEYVDSKIKRFTAVLTVNDWVGSAAPYKQTIGINGILGTDRPHYGPVYSNNTTTMLAEKEAWMLVDDLDTADGSVTFTCLEDKPKTNVTVQMEVHR